MTWRKGFFRLWAVLSIVWVLGAGYAMSLHSDVGHFLRLYGIVRTLEDNVAANRPFTRSDGEVISIDQMKSDIPVIWERSEEVKTRITESLWAVFTPPVAALIFLWLLGWVARGFRSAKQ